MNFQKFLQEITRRDMTSGEIARQLRERGIRVSESTIKDIRSKSPSKSGKNLFHRILAQSIIEDPNLSPKPKVIQDIGNAIINLRMETSRGMYGIRELQGEIGNVVHIARKRLTFTIMAIRADILTTSDRRTGFEHAFDTQARLFVTHLQKETKTRERKNNKVKEISERFSYKPTPEIVYPFLSSLSHGGIHLSKFIPYEGEVFREWGKLSSGINSFLDLQILTSIVEGGGSYEESNSSKVVAQSISERTGLPIYNSHIFAYAKDILGISL